MTMHLPKRKAGLAARQQRLALFRRFRKHQQDCAVEDGGTLTIFSSGRTERNFGGSPFGEHAISAFWRAISAQNFLAKKR